MIRICQVYKSFGNNAAIESVSLDIAQGEHVVLLGPSGSGKTTLLRMINGQVTPSSGSIRINGQNIREQPQDELRRQIGYVLQRNSLFPHYTVEENKHYPCACLGSADITDGRTVQRIGYPYEKINTRGIYAVG